jgi:hypothetical protein
MRAPLIAIIVSGIGGAVCAQSASQGPRALEACFQSARSNDAVCTDPANNATQRLECLQKARTTLLECMEQVRPEAEAAPAAAPPETSTDTAASEGPAGPSPELPTSTIKPLARAPGETFTATLLPEKPAPATPSDLPLATARSDRSVAEVSPESPKTATAPDKPVPAAVPDSPARAVEIPPKPRDPDWIVSETTSPVDYAPVITAAIRLPFSVKHAPNTFAVRCRGRRTEVLVRTEGTWRPSRATEVQVEFQINDQPAVRLPWTASADGRTASYKEDAVGLLQSLPDGARLKVNVLDGLGQSHEATFQLVGLDAVREKIAAACRWTSAAHNKMSSEKR